MNETIWLNILRKAVVIAILLFCVISTEQASADQDFMSLKNWVGKFPTEKIGNECFFENKHVFGTLKEVLYKDFFDIFLEDVCYLGKYVGSYKDCTVTKGIITCDHVAVVYRDLYYSYGIRVFAHLASQTIDVCVKLTIQKNSNNDEEINKGFYYKGIDKSFHPPLEECPVY